MAKKLVEEPFGVSLISGVENFYAQKGYVAFFCRKLLSHSAEDFRRGIFLCFKKFLVSNIFRDKSGWRVSRLFLKIAGSRNTESFGRGTILCFRKSRVWNNFMPESGKKRLSEETLLCPSTKKFRRATFVCIHKVFVFEKTQRQDGEERIITIYPKKFYVSQFPNILLV